MYQVNRVPDFDKNDDIQIQRAFEHLTPKEDGTFGLNIGWNMLRGEALTTQLIGRQPDMHGCDVFNEFVMGAVRLNEDGIPRVTVETLQHSRAAAKESFKPYNEKFIASTGGNLNTLADMLNSRLSKVRLEKVNAVKGEARYAADGREAALDRLAHSPVAELAYQGHVAGLIAWLHDAPQA